MSGVCQFKTIRRAHAWKQVGGYDPEQDGPDPRWGRIAVRCDLCGENRRIYHAVSFTDRGLSEGCIRISRSSRFRAGDLVATPGGRLDVFLSYLPAKKAWTYNQGGTWHVERSRDLRSGRQDD